MAIQQYIWIKNKRYYLYEKLPTFKEAIELAKRKKKENEKNKYFILCVEVSGFFSQPTKIYALYCTHFMKLI